MTTPDEDATYARSQQRLNAIRDELADSRDDLRDDRIQHLAGRSTGDDGHVDRRDEKEDEEEQSILEATSSHEQGSGLTY
jgi:hypothetical protein